MNVGAEFGGAVPRVEHQRAHRQFLGTVRPPAAMTSVVHARRALKRGHTAASLLPGETAVVTTTTVADDRLAQVTPDQEAAMVRAFGPDYHVPADVPVYGDMAPDRRRENARRVAAGTRKHAADLADTGTTVLPLVKGTTSEERAAIERVVADLDPPAAVIYATQYTTVSGNRQFPAVRERVDTVAAETDTRLLVIGYMNPTDPVRNREHSLAALPDAVVAAAGLNQWVQAVEPRSASPGEMRRRYADLHAAVRDTLDAGPGYDPTVAAERAPE